MSTQKNPITPEMKQFLGTLMKKLEKNIKQQYESELTNVKQQVIILKNRVKELERELKKQTPLITATPIKTASTLKKVHSSITPNPSSSNDKPTLNNKTKSDNPKRFVKKRTKTVERPPELQNIIDEVDQHETGVQDYFGNEELLSRKPTIPNTTLDQNILKPKPTTPTTPPQEKDPEITKQNSNQKIGKSKSPRRGKSPRGGNKSPRRTKSPRSKTHKNVLQATPSFKGQIKAVVGHRYLLLDDRYGVCKWVKGQKMGLELEIGQGDNDGEINGKKMFDCAPGMGLFTTIKNIQMDCGPV